jgi:hypothetical protein
VRVRRLRWALHDSVVVDARIDQDTARASAFVEAIYAERLCGVLVEMGLRGGWSVPVRRYCRSPCRSAAPGCPAR